MAKFIEIHYQDSTLLVRPQDIVSVGAENATRTNVGILVGGVTGHDLSLLVPFDDVVNHFSDAFESIGEQFQIGVARLD